MAPDARDRWFTFMLALIVILLGGLGTMELYLNNQLWNKLDRVTFLITREADTLHKRADYNQNRLDKVNETEAKIIERLSAVESTVGNDNGNGKHK